MMAEVVIEAPAGVPETWVALAAERCSAVLGSGRCRAGQVDATSATYAARLVPLDDDASTMRIELRRTEASPGLARWRDVAFSSLDSPEERWRSLGVVVAALVVLWRSEPPVFVPISAKLQPSLPAQSRVDGWADLGVANGDLFVWPPIPGVVARGALAYEPWRAFGVLGARLAHRFGGQLRLDAVSIDFGFGTRVGPWRGWWAVELHAQLEWQRIRVAASEQGRSEVRSTTRFGSRLGLDASLRVSNSLRAVLGVEAAVLRPEVLIDVHDVVAHRIEAASLGGFVGIRFNL